MHQIKSNADLRYKINADKMGAQFYMNPIRSYSGTFPNFVQPKEIGSFISDKRLKSLNKKQILEETENIEEVKNKFLIGVKYLILPETYPTCNFDLKIGFSEFVEHIPHQNGIDSILKWIIVNKSSLLTTNTQASTTAMENSIKRINADFICWRGMLTKILASPYENQNDWMFTVIYYKNTHYLCEIETDKQYQDRVRCPDKLKQFTYWGHKFETYVTADVEKGDPDGSSCPDPEDNYSTVVHSKLGLWSLIYAAEVDCCVTSDHKSLNNYCEIKTSRGTSINDLDFSRNLKFMKWWLQSFLVDTKKLFVGLRDDNGIVKKLLKCDTSTIYKEAQTWDASVCFNFLDAILNFIKTYCCDENCIYIFERKTSSTVISCKKTFDRKYHFLRDWYMNEI